MSKKFHINNSSSPQKMDNQGQSSLSDFLYINFQNLLIYQDKKVTNVGKNLLFWIHFWSSFCLQNGAVKCCGGSPEVSALIFLLKCRPKNFDKSIQIRFLKSFRSLLLLTEMSSRLVGRRVFKVSDNISSSFS